MTTVMLNLRGDLKLVTDHNRSPKQRSCLSIDLFG